MPNTIAPQFDRRVSLCTVSDLVAAARRCSGVCHTYSVETGNARARIVYSNPDEYGNPHPQAALFPIIKVPHQRPDVRVVMDCVRTLNDPDANAVDSFYDIIQIASVGSLTVRIVSRDNLRAMLWYLSLTSPVFRDATVTLKNLHADVKIGDALVARFPAYAQSKDGVAVALALVKADPGALPALNTLMRLVEDPVGRASRDPLGVWWFFGDRPTVLGALP